MHDDGYDSVFDEVDEVAIRGMETTLAAVDVILKTLLDQIQSSARAMERRGTPNAIGSEMGASMGALMRLAVQRQTIEELREAIPQAILYGNAKPAAGIIEVIS